MKNLLLKKLLLGLFFPMLFVTCNAATPTDPADASTLILVQENPRTYILPAPRLDGTMSVEQALATRRSHRSFQDRALSAEQLSQILWSAYGVTLPIPGERGARLRGGLRTAPSAGAMFPFEIYAIIGNVDGIEPGVYLWISEENKLIRRIDSDVREELAQAALGQMMVRDAPVSIFWSAVFSRMTNRYGPRGRERYVPMDLGHSAQNVYLQVTALGLGTVAIGAFIDARVSEILQLPTEEEPLYIMPVGYIR